MPGITKAFKWTLIFSLFVLLLAACTTTAGDEESAADAVTVEESPSAGESSATGEADGPSNDPASAEESVVDENTTEESLSDSDENNASADQESSEEIFSEDDDLTAAASTDSAPADDPAGETGEAEPAAGDEILTNDDRSDLLLQVTTEWETDFNRHTIPYSEIVPVLYRDAIRSLDQPTFETVEDASEWLVDEAPVIALDFEGDARAYPLSILTAHEIVNDEFGDHPIVITFCPLCNSALVFDSLFDGHRLKFGTTGLLRNSDLIMYDRTSETLWQQFTGEGIVGEYAGEQLTFLPSSIVSFSDFREGFPDGKVLSIDTGYPFPYDLGSYQAYDQIGQDPYLFLDYDDGEYQQKEIDRRLPAMERVVSIAQDGRAIAYPLSILSEVGVINDSFGDQDLAVFHTFGTTSSFYNPFSERFDDVGATGVFSPIIGDQELTFSKDGDDIVDEQTGTIWNILGQGVEGPLAGETLEPIVHGDHFWFSWAGFNPDTVLFEG